MAIVGDTEPLDVLGRSWMQAALAAPPRPTRTRPARRAGGRIVRRAGALYAVAQQAAAVEPLIAGFWQQGREQSRRVHALFWTRMADDGLLGPAVNLPWLISTTSILAAAETYLLVTRIDPDGPRRLRALAGPRLQPADVPPRPGRYPHADQGLSMISACRS